MIGFDRSALVASPSEDSQSKCEPCSRSIHYEGLPEHPIKNSNQTSVLLIFRMITKLDDSKGIRRRASTRYQKPERQRGQPKVDASFQDACQ